MKQVIMYTDGACSFNPGPGGYGIVLMHGNFKKEFSGFFANTTNNQMELMAVIEGLKKLKEPCSVSIHTDSAYVLNAFEQNWIGNWLTNNWKNAHKKPVLNKELWLELISLMEKHKVSWVKVKGHSTNELNNRCDELARSEIMKNTNNNPTPPNNEISANNNEVN